MEYTIINNQSGYMPIKKLAISQSQLENPDAAFQIFLWISSNPKFCPPFIEDKIKSYLENLSEKDELNLDAIKIKAERCCRNMWVLTLYVKVPSLSNVNVTEEEFKSFIRNNT